MDKSLGSNLHFEGFCTHARQSRVWALLLPTFSVIYPVNTATSYPGCQRFFLRGFRCRLCLYCDPRFAARAVRRAREKPSGTQGSQLVNTARFLWSVGERSIGVPLYLFQKTCSPGDTLLYRTKWSTKATGRV